MTKHTLDERVTAVLSVTEEHQSINTVVKEYNISKSTLKGLDSEISSRGSEGLEEIFVGTQKERRWFLLKCRKVSGFLSTSVYLGSKIWERWSTKSSGLLWRAARIQTIHEYHAETNTPILDELGYVPLHKRGAELLFQVINLCYEKKSIIVTTNLRVGQWNHIFDYLPYLTRVTNGRAEHRNNRCLNQSLKNMD